MSVHELSSINKTVNQQKSDNSSVAPDWTGNDELDKAIEIAGYSYDQKQDIFYSSMDPWQRDIGYCRLYDELAAPLGMIIDCEPVYFDYHDKSWMIGLWKGQYDLVTGGEIGVYTKAVDLNFLGLYRGAYYDCASNNDLLKMSYTLKKNGEPLFKREEKHWWLTGFKLGEFSNPSELTMDITITLQTVTMRNAFLKGLWNAGYSLDELSRKDESVSFTFGTPHTRPPITRNPSTDRFIQRKNQLLCEKYQEITSSSDNLQDKVKAIEEQAPEMFDKIIRTGKSKLSYEMLSSWLTRSRHARGNVSLLKG